MALEKAVKVVEEYLSNLRKHAEERAKMIFATEEAIKACEREIELSSRELEDTDKELEKAKMERDALLAEHDAVIDELKLLNSRLIKTDVDAAIEAAIAKRKKDENDSTGFMQQLEVAFNEANARHTVEMDRLNSLVEEKNTLLKENTEEAETIVNGLPLNGRIGFNVGNVRNSSDYLSPLERTSLVATDPNFVGIGVESQSTYEQVKPHYATSLGAIDSREEEIVPKNPIMPVAESFGNDRNIEVIPKGTVFNIGGFEAEEDISSPNFETNQPLIECQLCSGSFPPSDIISSPEGNLCSGCHELIAEQQANPLEEKISNFSTILANHDIVLDSIPESLQESLIQNNLNNLDATLMAIKSIGREVFPSTIKEFGSYLLSATPNMVITNAQRFEGFTQEPNGYQISWLCIPEEKWTVLNERAGIDTEFKVLGYAAKNVGYLLNGSVEELRESLGLGMGMGVV